MKKFLKTSIATIIMLFAVLIAFPSCQKKNDDYCKPTSSTSNNNSGDNGSYNGNNNTGGNYSPGTELEVHIYSVPTHCDYITIHNAQNGAFITGNAKGCITGLANYSGWTSAIAAGGFYKASALYDWSYVFNAYVWTVSSPHGPFYP